MTPRAGEFHFQKCVRIVPRPKFNAVGSLKPPDPGLPRLILGNKLNKSFFEPQKTFLRDRTVSPVEVGKHGSQMRNKAAWNLANKLTDTN
jgi:hypothetical protein